MDEVENADLLISKDREIMKDYGCGLNTILRMQGEKGTVIGEKSMKNEEYKNCQLKNLQKQQEDMKVTMLAFTKCARKIIRIFWKN